MNQQTITTNNNNNNAGAVNSNTEGVALWVGCYLKRMAILNSNSNK